MVQHTLNWYNGEIFEAKFILGFGIIVLISGVLVFFLGNSINAKAVLIPMLAIGIFFSLTGANMMYSNGEKVIEVQNTSSQNSEAFVALEIKRVEGFQYSYPLSIAISAVCFALALSFLYFSKNSYLQAVVMALILFGSAFAIIDRFSKESANIYYERLQSYRPIK